jgi:DNA (cytosine-5)-methyltransferase 1
MFIQSAGGDMRFLDLFAGIGGFRLGLERAGHECVGFCEIDEFARQTYKANFDTEGEVEWHDITKVTDGQARELRGKVDLIAGGFPCQAFSVAGKRRGFEDTRGTLFFEIARIAKQIEPRFLLLENVKGLLSHDEGRTFAIILSTLDELGYDAEWQVLNSKDFGVPQNRKRVFIIGHSRRFPRREVFPITRASGQTLRQIVGGSQGYRVYDPQGVSVTLASQAGGMGAKTGLYVVPVLTPDRVEKRQNGRRFKEPGEPMFTLTAQDRHGVLVKPSHIPGSHDINNTVRASGRGSLTAKHNHDIIHDGVRIRRLTPLECFRLQGFPDEHFHNAKAVGVSDRQLYIQAGNAVTVNVVYEIAKRLG